MVKCGETPLEGEGHVKTRETLFIWSLCMMVLWRLLCWIHVGEYSVHARLDYWIWLQNRRNTLLWQECSTSQCTKWDAIMAGGDELRESLNLLLLGLAFDDTTRTDFVHIPLSSRCTRHFSLPHHAQIFSHICPLGEQDRHVRQIVR